MPTPSKFADPVRRKILQALQVGASRRTAAAHAGVGEATLRRWLDEGRKAPEGSTSGKRKFYEQVREAEAHPRIRALGLAYDAMVDNPGLVKWFLERREYGYAPPVPTGQQAPTQAVVIQLSLADGAPVALSDTVIEVAPIEQDEATRSLPDPAPLASA